MKKIPTLFRRDPDDMRRVLPEVTPGCEWVLAGEGVPTRKYDGTCVRLTGDIMAGEEWRWWARREVKPGKQAPPEFEPVDHDEVTGKTVGWEPIEQTGWGRLMDEAGASSPLRDPGTYELCGPKVNGNPEGYGRHLLVRHDAAHVIPIDPPPADPVIAHKLLGELLVELGYEGIVWHHPDGRMAKLKARDFPR